VITAKPNELELLECWQENDPATGIRINFPVDAQTGAASSAAVYFEVEPKRHIGRHTHSAEEILFILEGEAEAVVGDERGRLSKEGMVVPARAPHDLYNVGEVTLRVVGFFSSAAVVTTFDDPLAPMGTKVPRARSAVSIGWVELGRSAFHWAGVTIVPGPSSCDVGRMVVLLR
jgi:quercetin dioxygenase-like cupin family protein